MHGQQTTVVKAAVIEPFFLETPRGRLFAIYHHPVVSNKVHGQILCVPPFNEEMNRCRSMITLQAQALAKIGFGTLLIDLYGTGDSDGEYGEARWSLWLQNLYAAKSWLDMQPGGCQVFWGIRLGAILASELHANAATPSISLVLWQPVTDGKTHLTQFFRVRIAAQMDRISLPKETTASMREQLKVGRAVEVAGYEIHPELATSIDNAKLANHSLAAGSKLLWLENAGSGKQEISPASQNVLTHWPGSNVNTSIQIFTGPAFWHMHERVLTPSIIEQTIAWFGKEK
jgi:exosortase A-associated hydrolase 2